MNFSAKYPSLHLRKSLALLFQMFQYCQQKENKCSILLLTAFIITFLFPNNIIADNNSTEIGFPFIKNWDAKVYQGHTQNFVIYSRLEFLDGIVMENK